VVFVGASVVVVVVVGASVVVVVVVAKQDTVPADAHFRVTGSK